MKRKKVLICSYFSVQDILVNGQSMVSGIDSKQTSETYRPSCRHTRVLLFTSKVIFCIATS